MDHMELEREKGVSLSLDAERLSAVIEQPGLVPYRCRWRCIPCFGRNHHYIRSNLLLLEVGGEGRPTDLEFAVRSIISVPRFRASPCHYL